MERLTERIGNRVINVKYASQHETAIHRLATIEDILGDEYDLDRLREMVKADKEGRSVVLPSEDAVFRQALKTYGPRHQTMMALEEMAELAKELCKASRGLGSVEHIAEEIADVQITLEQMIILHQCQGLVERIRAEKVKRLLERMEKRTDRTATDAPGQRREKVGLP